MKEPLWTPSSQAISASNLTKFTQYAAAQTGREFADYPALHTWSVSQPEEFWQTYWAFGEIHASRPASQTVVDVDKFPGARWFPQARLNYAENLLQERSNHPAFVSILENGQRRTISYADLYDQTAAVASQLKQLGIASGDRVAGWLPNIPEAVVAMLATSSIGAIWSSCSPDFGASGALERFGQIEPKVLFACENYSYNGKTIDVEDKVREVARQIPSIKRIVWINIIVNPLPEKYVATNLDGETNWQAWLNEPYEPLQFEQLPFNHPLFILYSSGTTGKPKCIVHGQGGTLIQHKKEHQLHVDLTPSDTLFFFTTCGWMMWNWLVSALACKCTIVLFDGSPFHPSPEAMFDICEREKVSVFGISAKFLGSAQKADVLPARSHNLMHMRMLISTGSPLTQEGFQYFYHDIKPDCHLVSMSGGTDIISCFMLGNPNLPVYEGELQCAGLGMAVEIWDDEGKRLDRGKGELVCTKPFPSSPIGFWHDANDEKYYAAYYARFPNIWVHGDYAEQTASGGYIIHGRSDAVLNPGGVRIGTAEIYRQVEHFAEIVDAVCVGQTWDNDVRVILFVVLKAEHTLNDTLTDAIKLRIRQNASPKHTPAKVIAVTDIPRTMSGKISELAVRDVIHGREVKNTSALANPEALKLFNNLAMLAEA